MFPPVVSSSGAGSQVAVPLLLFQPQAPLQLATSDAITSSPEFDQICKLGPEWVNTENKQAEEETQNRRKSRCVSLRGMVEDVENNSNSSNVALKSAENMTQTSVYGCFYLVVHPNDV